MDFPLSCLITRGYIPICPTFPMIADSHPLLVGQKSGSPIPHCFLIPRGFWFHGPQSTTDGNQHKKILSINKNQQKIWILTLKKKNTRGKFWRSKKSQNSHKIIAMLRIIAGDHVTMALFFGELGILGAFGVLVDGNLENLLGHVSPGTQQKYMEDQHFEQVNSG